MANCHMISPHWVRLGASLDAAGIAMAQALQLLGGDAALKERVIAHVGQSRSTLQRRTCTSAASVTARAAQLEEEVRAGLRPPESLLLLSRERLKGAKFVARAPVVDSTPPRTKRVGAVRAKLAELDLTEADVVVAVKRARKRS